MGSLGSTMFCKAKSAKKTFFCTAIFDNFQTKMFISETTSFHYISSIPLETRLQKKRGKYVFLLTVRSLAPIRRSTTRTRFSEHFFMQTHTAIQRMIKGKGYHVRLVCKIWLVLEYQTSPHCHALLGRQGSLVVRLICMPSFIYLGNIP